MREKIQGIGWLARRTPDPWSTVAFYRDVLGITQLRDRDWAETDKERNSSIMMWAGESTAFWVTEGGTRPPVFTDRNQEGVVPLWRVYGIDGVVDRITKAGATIINDMRNDDRRIIYFLDPSGNITGLQERARTSDRDEDQEAYRRWDAGETTIAGVKPLAPDLQHLAWIVIFSHDPESEVKFWSEIMGLEAKGSNGNMLPVGEGMLLEISKRAEGWNDPTPTDRKDVNNVPILRVHGLDSMYEEMASKGVRFTNTPFHGRTGALAYFLTPSGQVFGLQERDPNSVRMEDQEADRRWAALGN